MSAGCFIADLSMLYFKKIMFEKSNNKYFEYFINKYIFYGNLRNVLTGHLLIN